MSNCHDFISQLIATVRENKCLYYKKDAFYYNKAKRQEAWDAIALVCGRSSRECRERWKLLRERFCKHLKKVETHQAGEGEPPEEWQFFQELIFLKESIVPRGPRYFEAKNGILQATLNGIAAEDDSKSSTSYPAKRSRLMFDQTETQLSEQHLFSSTVTPKIELDEMCSGFVGKVDKSVETERTTDNDKRKVKPEHDVLDGENNADELFARHIACLMKDLPIDVKDKFQADMYAEVFRLRAQVRGGS